MQFCDYTGQRNETLRAQLESIEFSFRDIEAIRRQFHDALTLIDQTLVEIERTKVAHLEAERKLENLFAEGALRSARQERSARRQEGYDVAAEAPSVETESADSKVTWLRR